jgi:surface antigen Omp85-like protein
MRAVFRAPLVVLVALLMPHVAAAQSSATEDALPLPPAAQAVFDAFNKPLHPIIGGVAPGGGMGVGVGYNTPKSEDWFHDAEARITINRYWSLVGETGRQTQRSRVGVFGEIRHMNRLDFFGIGPDSRRANRTDFRLRETSAGAQGWIRATPALRLGGIAQMYSPELGSGQSPSVLSIEQFFTPSSVPGFNADPVFARYRGYAELVYPVLADTDQPNDEYRGYQGTYQLAVESFRDTDTGQHNFHRWETEVQQRFAGFRPGHRFTVHGLMAATNNDADVPFYLQYTLGGGGGLTAFRPNTIGTDGTKATLRGYQNYRFRDTDIVLMQGEYRIPLHKTVDATVFVDAGQVAPTVPRLFSDWKTGTGFSLSYMRKGAALARLDVGYGSGEGMHFFWSFGGFLQ